MDIEHPSRFAASAPDRPAVIVAGTGDTLTYGELEARSNQVAHALRALGLGVGDHVAVLMENRVEYFEAVWGAFRAGLYVTPVNWHLAPDEAAYVVDDCGAGALLASATCASRCDLPPSPSHSMRMKYASVGRKAITMKRKMRRRPWERLAHIRSTGGGSAWRAAPVTGRSPS